MYMLKGTLLAKYAICSRIASHIKKQCFSFQWLLEVEQGLVICTVEKKGKTANLRFYYICTCWTTLHPAFRYINNAFPMKCLVFHLFRGKSEVSASYRTAPDLVAILCLVQGRLPAQRGAWISLLPTRRARKPTNVP